MAAKTESRFSSHSLLTRTMSEQRKSTLTREKLYLGYEKEVNAASEFEFQEHDIWESPSFGTDPDSERMTTVGSFRDKVDSGYGLASLSPLVSSSSSASSMIVPSKLHILNKSEFRPKKVLMRQQSAPMNVPDWGKILGKSISHDNQGIFDDRDDEEEEIHRLPPHELAARDYARSQIMSFSVHEGAGHTLKGRDLSRVRNAVLKQTGFL